MNFDRKYLVWGLAYAIAGMILGIFMAASHDHSQHVTHAHILLVGFVVSLIYAIIHKLWLGETPAGPAKLQFILHQAGAIVLTPSLLLAYGGIVPIPTIEPVLSVASITVLIAAALMLYLVVKSNQSSA